MKALLSLSSEFCRFVHQFALENVGAGNEVADSGLEATPTMCLAVPAKILTISDNCAVVDIDGVRRETRVDFIEDPRPGDYVLVHVGFALQKIDESEAEATLAQIRACFGGPDDGR